MNLSANICASRLSLLHPGKRRRALIWWEVLQSLDRGIEIMREDQAAELGDLERESGLFSFVIGDADQDQRRGRRRVVASLDGGDLLRLVFEGVEAMLVAGDDL